MPPAKKTTTPKAKAPTDRLAPKEKARPQDTPGFDLLKPFSDVPVWDQTPLLSMIQKLHDDRKGISNEEFAKMTPAEREAYNESRESFASVDINMLGELARALLPFAVDQDAYTKFVSGTKGMENAMNLAMAWVGQMGEFGNSEDS